MKCTYKYIIILILFSAIFFGCDLNGYNSTEDVEPIFVETSIEIETEEFLNPELKKENTGELRAGVVLTNLWVVQFDSISKQCNAVYFTESFDTGERLLNPTLITGTNKVIYVIANGPAAGSITTSTYTLDSFRSSGLFSGQITDESKIPYIGQVPGMVTVNASGKISNAWSVKLTRISARVGLNLFFNIDGFTLESVKMYNKPLSMYYLNGWSSNVFPAVPSVSNISSTPVDADVIPADLNNGQYLWFTGENKRGTNNAITTYTDKDINHTPSGSAYCTYIRILARKNSSSKYYTYDLFLGTNETTDFNLKRNWYYNYSVTLQGNEIVQDYWDSVDGRITKSTETANCYILAPGKSITIPVNIKGNGNPQTIESGINVNHSATSMAIVWQTSAGLVSLSDFNATNQTVRITAPGLYTSGNALIVAKNGTDTVWSWHIWVTDYNPTTTGRTYTYTNSGGVTNIFMDRNLGYVTGFAGSNDPSSSLYYQFGRKDPFLRSRAATYFSQKGSVKVGIAYTYTNPQIFNYYFNTVPTLGGWYSGDISELWMGEGGSTTTPGVKTIYDPCPEGWRVPAFKNNTYPWAGISSYTNPRTGVFSLPNLGEYTMDGWVDLSTNSLYGTNSFTKIWTANATNNAESKILEIKTSSTGVSIGGLANYHLAPVRCVKDW